MAIATMTLIMRVIVVILLSIGVNAEQTLRLGVLVSQEGDFDFTGLIPAMNLALDTINSDTTLPFNFYITLNDSKVSECCLGAVKLLHVALYVYSRYRLR